MFSATAMLQQKIDCPAGDFRRHQPPVMAKRTGRGKTVAATQITVMSDMQAKRFHDRLGGKNRWNLGICRKQLSGRHQFMQFFQGFAYRCFAEFSRKLRDDRRIVRPVKNIQDPVGDLVEHMYRTAVHVQ